MVEVVADRFKRNRHQELHHLGLGETHREECVNRRTARMTALRDQFPDEADQRIRLLVAGGLVGTDRGNGRGRHFLKGFGNRAVSSGAIAAFILQTGGEEGKIAFLRGERGFSPFRIQRQVAFQHFGRVGKGRHQVRDKAKAFLNGFHDGFGAGRRVGNGQWLEEVCGRIHIILLVRLFNYLFCLPHRSSGDVMRLAGVQLLRK